MSVFVNEDLAGLGVEQSTKQPSMIAIIDLGAPWVQNEAPTVAPTHKSLVSIS